MTDVLQLASEGKASDVMRDMRVRALYSNYYFVKVVLGYSRLTDYFHQVEMEDFLNRWSNGETKQAIEWSRGFYKTTCFTIGTSMWVTLPPTDNDNDYAIYKLRIPEEQWFNRIKLHNQNIRQLLAFETSDNAEKKIGHIKKEFEENDLFRSLFPEIAYDSTQNTTWNNTCLIIKRTGNHSKYMEGTFEAIGAGGALQSRHYDLVWEDDLIGKSAVESDAVMQKTIRWHGLLHGCFVDATRQVRFLVSNRWALNDLNSYIRANEPDFHFHTQSAWHLDPESGEEIATFPYDGDGEVMYTLENLQKIKNSGSMTPYDFSCQYLNSPRLPGENDEVLRLLHKFTVKEGRIECDCGAKWYPEQLSIYMHYDPYNAKGVSSTSCPAIVIVGLAPDKHVFLLDYWMNRGVYEAVYNKLYEYNDQWRPHTFTYEDVGHQNMTEFHIREVEKNPLHLKKHTKFPRIVPVPTKGREKSARIRDHFFPYIDQGKFSVRPSKHLAFTSMLENFPNKVLDHDYDLLDALAQGATIWRYPLESDAIERDKEEEDKYLKELGKPYTQLEYVR